MDQLGNFQKNYTHRVSLEYPFRNEAIQTQHEKNDPPESGAEGTQMPKSCDKRFKAVIVKYGSTSSCGWVRVNV